MTDIMTKEKRHLCMSHIKGKNTRPEWIVRRFLFHHGFRYRLHDKRIPGSPDIVLSRYHTVIFVNGCFWHSHDCLHAKLPKTNTDFWEAKMRRNKERDADNYSKLHSMGWNVILIWECELKPSKRDETLEILMSILRKMILQNTNHKLLLK